MDSRSTGGTAHTGAVSVAEPGELEPGTMVGEYRIEGTLGQGGMGRVYSAIHPVIAKRAAIKVLHPQLSMDLEAIQRFAQEARAVNQIGHPNIVDIFAFGTLPDGRQYFVMEWLRGESLRERVEHARLPIAEVLQLVETVTLPLEAAHEQGIIHRDLKPDNVFLVEVKGDRPTVKLLDFGIAKLAGPDKVTNTRTGNVLGTPAYISPEQARGENVDHRTDIYALGAMLFELLTGEMVFDATNAADMIAKQLFEEPRVPSTLVSAVSPQLDTLILRMLAKDQDARPPLDEVRSALRACRHSLGAVTPAHGTLIPAGVGAQVTPYGPHPGVPTSEQAVQTSRSMSAPPKSTAGRNVAIALILTLAAGAGVIALATGLGGSESKPERPAETIKIEATPTPSTAPTPDQKAPVVDPPTETKVDPTVEIKTDNRVEPDIKTEGVADQTRTDPKADPKLVRKRPSKPVDPNPKGPAAKGSGSGSAVKPRDRDAPM